MQEPGPALDVNQEIDGEKLVTVSDVPTYESNTEFFMTTVSALGNADYGLPGAAVLVGLASPTQEVVAQRLIYPPEVTAQEVEDRNIMLMDSSQDTAAAVALAKAGMEVTAALIVADVPDDSPAAGKLQAGDNITQIGDQPVRSFLALANALSGIEPGTPVVVHGTRDGAEFEATITTRGNDPDPTGWVKPGSLLGVVLSVDDVKLPADVDYLIEDIGGPSAGLVFTLAIYDAVTPGDLGGSAKIAGTGAISWNGDVDPIGGIRHKLQGAKAAGATDFLAPATNCAETHGWEPAGLNVWAVRNIDDAIAASQAIGAGDTSALTPCSDVNDVDASE